MLLIANKWRDYEVIDSGGGEKLERWGDIILRRPDPCAIWSKTTPHVWEKSDATYYRSEKGGGHWEFARKLPESWRISYQNLNFSIRPTNFKHTGLFPEQAANWDFIMSHLKPGQRVLNLFAYTGGATMAALSTGAAVLHVDAAKGMLNWAKLNQNLSKLPNNATYYCDDCEKVLNRELRRGNKYDAIIMDPPTYGRGAKGEVWKIEEKLQGFVELCEKVLSDNAQFVILNSYSANLGCTTINNVMRPFLKNRGGKLSVDELVLPVSEGGFLPCGTVGRWKRSAHSDNQ